MGSQASSTRSFCVGDFRHSFATGGARPVRTVVRAGILAATALAYAIGARSASETWSRWTAWVVAFGVLFVVVVLSAEADSALRRVVIRRKRKQCADATVEIAELARAVRRTDAWSMFREYGVSDGAIDSWLEGCWQYLTFGANSAGRKATVVFAVELPLRRRERVPGCCSQRNNGPDYSRGAL